MVDLGAGPGVEGFGGSEAFLGFFNGSTIPEFDEFQMLHPAVIEGDDILVGSTIKMKSFPLLIVGVEEV